jgi:hypothetical protein
MDQAMERVETKLTIQLFRTRAPLYSLAVECQDPKHGQGNKLGGWIGHTR